MTRNMLTNTLTVRSLLPFILLAACNPCEQEAVKLTDAIVHFDVCDADDSAGDTGPICSEIPVGEPWGACKPDGSCTGEANFCTHSEAGSVCLPACTDAGPSCGSDLCGSGACRQDGACAPACNTDDDCPIASMVCDLGAPGMATCVHPD